MLLLLTFTKLKREIWTMYQYQYKKYLKNDRTPHPCVLFYSDVALLMSRAVKERTGVRYIIETANI